MPSCPDTGVQKLRPAVPGDHRPVGVRLVLEVLVQLVHSHHVALAQAGVVLVADEDEVADLN